MKSMAELTGVSTLKSDDKKDVIDMPKIESSAQVDNAQKTVEAVREEVQKEKEDRKAAK